MVDIDCKNGKNGLEMWNQMAAANNHEGLADAVCTRTPSGGLHYYFHYTPELAHGQEKCFKVDDTWADIDIRNKKNCGFGICSPSPGYTWVRSPFDHPLTQCPQWIIDWHKASKAQPVKQQQKERERQQAKTAKSRGHNTVVVKLAALQILVHDLPPKAYENYDSWLSVLMAIHRISHENDYVVEGLALAHEFSAKFTKYQESEVDTKWESFDADLAPGMSAILKLSGQSYEAKKADFEMTCFKIEHPLQYCMHRDAREIWSYSTSDFKNVHMNKYFYSADGKQEPFIHKWMMDPHCRTYSEIVFNPPPLPPLDDTYNLFNGLASEKLPPNEHSSPTMKPILDHIETVMVAGDLACKDYFIKWLAQRVQFPGIRLKVAICLKSLQGSGKGIILEWFGAYILGQQYFFNTAGMRDLTGHFNEGLMNRLFIYLDETKTKQTFATADELKRLIDAPNLKVNKKYCPVMDLRNCCGWVFASNNALPVKVEQGDRRYALFKCSDHRKGDTDCFTKLGEYIARPEVIRAFYDYLMAIDLSDFHPERDRPITNFYQDAQEATTPAHIGFIAWLIEEGKLKKLGTIEALKPGEMKDLWNSYKRLEGIPDSVLSGNRLAMELKPFFDRKIKQGYELYMMDFKYTTTALVEAGYKQFAPIENPSFFS